MKLFARLLVLGLAADVSLASNWFYKAPYNKWHETELERWLSDHNIPYPTPYDRKQLNDLVKSNWQARVLTPYHNWEPSQLSAYLTAQGLAAEASAKKEKDDLISLVRTSWDETSDKAEEAWADVRDWIFDSWSESQLKAFCDYHGIPVPQPSKKDTLLAKARANYEIVANKLGETMAYPGDWLYSTWSESELKNFLDTYGIPAPQPTTRDKMVSFIRRNARLAHLKIKAAEASASAAASSSAASASAAIEAMSEKILEAWSDIQIKEWAAKSGINIPQGATRAEMLAIARKHRDKLTETGERLSASAASAFGAATSSAGNEFAKATDDAELKLQHAFDSAVDTWSNSRLKAYLDERGVPVPQSGKRDELLATVRLYRHKAATGFSVWTFDTWTVDNLKKYLESTGDKAAKKVAKKSGATRDELLKAAQDSYKSASAAGGAHYASATSYLAKATDIAHDKAFDAWTDTELKAYLDSYGVPVPQGSTTEQLKAYARNQLNWFKYGTTTPQGILWAKMQEAVQWIMGKLSLATAAGREAAASEAQKAGHRVQEGYHQGADRVAEHAEKATNMMKEDL